MLTLWGSGQRLCNGVSRRNFLAAGALGLGGLTLADLLRLEAQASESPRRKSLIYIVLDGGPSHIDMWDLKPGAPAEIRGPFQPCATRLPGVHICADMPLQAQIMDRIALVRGIRSVENDHFLSEVYSGLPRPAGQRPAFGSVVSRLAGTGTALPAYVSLNRPTTDQFEFEKPHYAGSGHAPFRPFGAALENMTPVRSRTQLDDRRDLLARFDAMRREVDRGDSLTGMDRFRAEALDIITSPRVREAFDLSREPNRVRDRYGRGRYPHQTVKDIYYPWEGTQFLLARRLVEAGVRVVTLRVGSWDHHSGPTSDIFHCLRHLMPALDRSLYALATDLRERGLDDDVLVVVLGEFGRTPRIAYPGPGREHWADAGCALFLGGGLRMGQVIGDTDGRGERARGTPVTFQNIMATIYRVLGVNPAAHLVNFTGRPVSLLDDTTPIEALDPPLA